MDSPLPPPRILLVEDDPVSATFLAAAVEALPAEAVVAADCAAALAITQARPFDLWLIDANLPDGSGVALLQALRERAPATPALAHTAACEPGALDPLLAAGFAEALVKPLTAAALQAALRRALGLPPARSDAASPCEKLPLWDDAAGAAALGGNTAHLATLRRLFLAELPLQRDAVFAALAANDAEALAAQLHRLRASCGFVGAARLGAAVHTLQSAPAATAARECFTAAVAAVLDSA